MIAHYLHRVLTGTLLNPQLLIFINLLVNNQGCIQSVNDEMGSIRSAFLISRKHQNVTQTLKVIAAYSKALIFKKSCPHAGSVNERLTNKQRKRKHTE